MGGNSSLVGIPYEYDLDGDGVFTPEEQAHFLKQFFVATGTDANVLAQNAANFGLLEPET